MATSASIGHGSKFYIGNNNSPGTWTEVAEITSITPPSVTRDIIDATHSGSPDRWREHIPGLKDGGEVTVEGNFVPGGTENDLLITIQGEDDPRAFRIEFPDATVWQFVAYCTAYVPSVPFDDKMTFSATFKVSGKPQFVTDAETP